MLEVSSETAKKFILDTQGLRTKSPSKSVLSVAKRVHNIQIDTMSVVSRSQNLIVYNRFPRYKEGEVWKDLEKGKLFEYWSHSLCLIPIKAYPFYATKMEYNKTTSKGYYERFGVKMKDTIREVFEYIKKNGLTSSSDFKGQSLGWGGSLESRSMQYLHYTGQIMIAFRKNFQKFYDLTERVLPSSIVSTPMEKSDVARFLVETTLRSLGLGNYQDIRSYLGSWPTQFLWDNRKSAIDDYLDEMVNEGNLERVKVEGVKDHYYMLSKNVKKLEKIAVSSPEDPVKFLSPFDNIIRERHYPLKIWGFDYKLESYVPPDQRKYGYHILPILDESEIVGRVDAKVYRNENRLELISLYLESDFWKDIAGLERLVRGLHEFREFHGVEEISVGNVTPEGAKNILLDHLGQ